MLALQFCWKLRKFELYIAPCYSERSMKQRTYVFHEIIAMLPNRLTHLILHLPVYERFPSYGHDERYIQWNWVKITERLLKRPIHLEKLSIFTQRSYFPPTHADINYARLRRVLNPLKRWGIEVTIESTE